MKVNEAPIHNNIVYGFIVEPAWEYFLTEVSDALVGEWEYNSKRVPTLNSVIKPSRVVINKAGKSINFLIQWDVNVVLNGSLVFADKSLSMLGGKLTVYDGDTLLTNSANCINDTITLPSYTSTNGSVTIQGTILTKKQGI